MPLGSTEKDQGCRKQGQKSEGEKREFAAPHRLVGTEPWGAQVVRTVPRGEEKTGRRLGSEGGAETDQVPLVPRGPQRGGLGP